MEILRKNSDQNLIVNPNQMFKTDLGWTDNAEMMENEILYQIINPTENYETVRYVHSPYTSGLGVNQTDIWFYFYFLDGTNSYTNGLDYNHAGITYQENAKMLKQSTESFFRLEFYKTSNDEAPTNLNRRLVFAKNLSLPLSEKQFYLTLNDYIFVPVFMGSNYRNKENMYFFWFSDDTAFDETNLTGNTFYMTAKFYNSKDGSVIDFTNKSLNSGTTVNEVNDLYFKVIIDRTDFSYQIFRFDGTIGTRIGESNDPIKFYERRQ